MIVSFKKYSFGMKQKYKTQTQHKIISSMIPELTFPLTSSKMYHHIPP